MSEPGRPRTDSVKSADRALAIIDYVGERGDFSLAEVLRDLALPRSSAHGLLATLVGRGWLEHDGQTHRYRLGLRAWSVGQTYTGHVDVARVAEPVMDELRDRLEETIQLARLQGTENVYIAISEARRPMRLASSVGMRLDSHATGIGKALLAQLDPAEATRRLGSGPLARLTDRTIVDPDLLAAELDLVRERGWAQDTEEFLPGCRCVAVPVYNDAAGLIVALSVTAPTSRVGPDWPTGPLAALNGAAATIRQRIELITGRPHRATES
ncbi:IclR family transcriptional regulator [Nakamurella lactea]|uniref:IclR family transcriptional regulator n=1 Tax=Nakamurella lactea TaxID=459515 RepID=UPI00040CEEB0|nr:IclR family transcriptional regulator [Nakamurella lactea]